MYDTQYLLSHRDELISKKRNIKRELLLQDNLIEKRIAILSGSTIGEIRNILELFLLSYGIKPVFWIGDYNRYYEDAMFENKSLTSFEPEVIYIHTTNKNIDIYPSISDKVQEKDEKLISVYSKYEQIWTALLSKYQCPLIQNNFELLPYRIMGNADAYLPNGKTRFINELNIKFCDYAEKTGSFYINDINYIASYFGIEKWSDTSSWCLYKYALCLDAVPLLCLNIANIIKSIFGKNKKAVILDLDNTLWGGVLGDDGVENIELGEETPTGRAHTIFQQYLKELSDIGILLNICSKNDFNNAEKGFEREACILKKEDFTSLEINWNNKHENIEKIAREINLLLGSLVFIDDNAVERDIVKNYLPEIEVPEMTSPEDYIKNIDQMGYFEVTSLSNDDINRKRYYDAEIKRQQYSVSFQSYSEYLMSLQMTARIGSFDGDTLERVTQLINKTNQFNLTTQRYSQADVEKLVYSNKHITIKADLEDKFGNNGIVSALIARIDKGTAIIELWVMSCRVFKRDLEFAVFDDLVLVCKEKGIEVIRGIYRPSKKNLIVKDFYSELGFTKVSENDYETIWEYIIPNDYVKKNSVIGVRKNDERRNND